MSYELFIALRYLRAKRRQAAVSVITAIAVIGITVGVAALIIAQALITGFRSDVQEKILQGTAHLNLLKADNGGIEDYRELVGRIGKVEGVRAASATIYAPALLTHGDQQEHSILKGIDPDAPREANEVFSASVQGDPSQLLREAQEPPPDQTEASEQDAAAAQPLNGIVVGQQLAVSLNIRLNDTVTAISAYPRLTPAGMQVRPHYTRFRVVGIFASGLYEYDAKWAYISLSAAQRMSGNGETAGVIQMKLTDIYAVDKIGARVRQIAGRGFTTTNWQELNRPLFAALQLQHRLVIIFFALLIAIAALNIITALTMMVIEKHKDIAILRAQGATPRAIRKIFILQGGIIGVVGAGLGLALGLTASWLANAYHLVSISGEFYAISYITLKVQAVDCLGVTFMAILICLLATLYPSRTAARLAPVEALRYE
ncbi:MAG TPA: ABC transporter permease [Blastocatellia bacterium]|nr:ABC transporter permease [Blastocatellia bacterium]